MKISSKQIGATIVLSKSNQNEMNYSAITNELSLWMSVTVWSNEIKFIFCKTYKIASDTNIVDMDLRLTFLWVSIFQSTYFNRKLSPEHLFCP